MNPAHTPLSDAPWGINMPGHLIHKTALDSEVSPDLAQNVFEGIFHCHSCGKQYTRHCDLNKHIKTHSRPFKCPVDACRYSIFGWPTEKELDRHYNDKHSKEPQTFDCLWHDCNYSSKRESNCKQHMEKVHGYHYVRSRTGNQDEDTANPCVSPGGAPFAHPKSKLAIRTVPDVLLTPSALGQCSPAALDSSSSLDLDSTMSYDHIPWRSPVATVGNNDGFLQDYPQAYATGPSVVIQDSEWLRVPLDPRLQESTSPGTSTPENTPTSSVYSTRGDLFRTLPHIVTPKSSPTVTSQVLTPVSEPSPILVQQATTRSQASTPQDAENPRGQGHTEFYSLGSSNTAYLNTYGKRQVRFARKQEDDSDDDNEPPVKRSKAPGGNDDESGDPEMFCPFRIAHPEIYDVEVHSRYYSCHTKHNNISTVVRHLGRPAHNLKVDNSRQAIHSFDVRDNEHAHPAAGLCKKCWRSFTDREAFDAHFRGPKCETASRSKREKFQALIDTFCVTNQGRQRGAVALNDSVDDELDDVQGDNDVPMSGASSRSHSRGEDVVSRLEYQTLVDRVTALEQILTGRLPNSTPRTMPSQQSTVARAFTTSPAIPSQEFGYYSFDSGQSSAAATGRDPRTGLVGEMATRPVQSGDQTITGFYGDTDRMVPTYGPSMNRRTDSVSTVRRTSPRTASAGPAAQQAGGNPTGQAMSDSAHGTDGNSALVGGHLASQQGSEAFGSAAATAVGDGPVSQQSSTPRWEHNSVQVGDDMMRSMDFFNTQGSGYDISKFLNMDSQ
ncbi:hypothetical protein N0V93_005585 [Gnomoniopsis smithogilvyi]|uniref:C2H2-type domain-containing protein n=1 Tax=Gnomoniopsis smithogilvyi TaxID=1191159 RepID=A0A9W8YUW5_9PEZI|nr:hypothetical protein N0V93_005585 [Gnomoniopsis smithogilvyi]